MDSTNDLFLLKNCLLSLSKISLGIHREDENINTILIKLISKLETSDNGYVHGAIGNYYLFNQKVIICCTICVKLLYILYILCKYIYNNHYLIYYIAT